MVRWLVERLVGKSVERLEFVPNLVEILMKGYFEEFELGSSPGFVEFCSACSGFADRDFALVKVVVA